MKGARYPKIVTWTTCAGVATVFARHTSKWFLARSTGCEAMALWRATRGSESVFMDTSSRRRTPEFDSEGIARIVSASLASEIDADLHAET